MSLHYIRDHLLPEISDPSAYEYNAAVHMWILYHLLRCMGWEWLWQCDGQNDTPNPILDADMEASGTSDWAAVGTGALAKDTGEKHQGAQSLKVTSNAANDGVEDAAFTVINGSAYWISIWVFNDSGDSWNFDVDNGGGYVTAGSIPDNGGTWTRYEFTYNSSAVTNKFRVVDNNNTQGDIYLDDAVAFLETFEKSEEESGTDGDVQNGDEFNSTVYTFVAGDIGKTLCFYDPVNPLNTGAYEIAGVNAGNAVLDLRVGGAETLTNTSVGTLVWRMIDYSDGTTGLIIGATAFANASEGAGVGLQSPHSSGWRWFWRWKAVQGSSNNNFFMWTAPIDTEFSALDGAFTPSGPSSSNSRLEPFTWAGTQEALNTGAGAGQSSGSHRFYAMVASDGAFAAWAGRPTGGNGSYCCGAIGILSDDTEFTERERFFQLGKNLTTGSELDLIGVGSSFGYNGICGTNNDRMYNSTIACLATISYVPMTDVNSRSNIYSSEEWMFPLLLLRGYDFSGIYGELEMDREEAFFGTRENMTQFTTFDSDGYIHLLNGLVWKWSGISILG